MSIGTISAYSAYIDQMSPVYGSQKVGGLKQANSDVQNLPPHHPDNDINDEATISDEAKALFEKDKTNSVQGQPSSDEAQENKNTTTQSKNDLTPEQEQEVAKLKARDAEVKTHEQAHLSAASGISASAPTYTYETGPDGEKYAIGGEVSITVVQTGNPQKDLQSAQTMRAAALAPSQPSSQDLSVARNADKMIEDDKKQIEEEKSQQYENSSPKPSNELTASAIS